MASLDRPWALDRLRKYRDLLRLEQVLHTPGVVMPTSYRLVADQTEVSATTHIVEQILDRVIPGWRTETYPGIGRAPYAQHREATTRAISQLEAEDELAAHLGEAGPQLAGASLHPWVWDAASSLWQSAHYRDAVGAAARSLNAHTQTKLGRRDESEAKLLQDAFSTKPPVAGHPRLRLMTDDGSDTFANRHEGAGALARGVFVGIRNPLAHEVDEDELLESVALEYLAAFSVLARWVDDAAVDAA